MTPERTAIFLSVLAYLSAPNHAAAQSSPESASPSGTASILLEDNFDQLPYEVLLLKGNLARGRKQFGVATSYFSKAAAKSEVTAKLYLLWARTERERGDLSSAEQVVGEGLKRFPSDNTLKMERGFLLAFAERWPELRTLLESLPESDKTHVYATYLQGQLAIAEGRFQEAVAHFSQSAQQAHPYQAEAFAGIADAQKEMGDRQSVVDALEQAIASSRSARQRTEYEQRLESFLKSSTSTIYSIRVLSGLNYDSNINLAPLLFADTAQQGLRWSTLLQQQLNLLRKDKTTGGLQMIASQSLNFGADTAQLADFNATLLNAEAFLQQTFSKNAAGRFSIAYDSVYLLFRSGGVEKHFSERWHGGPRLDWNLERWDFATALVGEWSRYYSQNPIGTVDDRSTQILDGRANFELGYRIKRHRVGSEFEVLYFDARGDNFDSVGALIRPNYRFAFDPWLLSTFTGFEIRAYGNNNTGRQDQIVAAGISVRRLLSKKHLVGVNASYEENLDSGFYGYRRGMLGVNYQGLLLEL